MNRSLQDAFKVHCFGCGALNANGLKIKSMWDGDDMLCNWQPEPYHIGHPGYVYGGTIASVVDCHCIWTALAHHCREVGHALDDGPPPFAFVTGSLKVDYLKPVPIEGAMNHGLARLPDLPVSVRLIREIHAELMHDVRGGHLQPGELRTSQNWIGPAGCRLNTATFVPPPPSGGKSTKLPLPLKKIVLLGSMARALDSPTPREGC